MISKDVFTVYAQYNEDIIIAALLYNVKKGFYVDVGANEEEYHSVTKYFYKRGWHGINVEPITRLAGDLKKKRQRDITLSIAVSSKEGKLKFREYPGYDGLSTLSSDSKLDLQKLNIPHVDYEVKVDTLENIFNQYKVGKIDLLKIDVEGYEFEVLKGNKWDEYRPTLICIEANHRVDDWSTFLQSKDYIRIIFDGLNEYYVLKDSINMLDGFGERATLLAHNAIRHHHVKAWQSDIKRIKFLEGLTNKQDELIHNIQSLLILTRKELEEYKQLSFKDKRLKDRFMITIRGLTTDYFKHKLRR